MKYTPAQIDSSLYGYRPEVAANMVGLVLFSLLLIIQALQGAWTRQWWFFVTWVCGLVLQVLGYVGRVVSYYNLENFTTYKMQLASLTISPAFLMAGIYYQLAKLTTVYGEKYSLLPPMGYSAIFIVCDVVSILVQAAGGGIAAGAVGNNSNLTNVGSYVMVGGLAFQVLTMLIFIVTFAYFWWNVARDSEPDYEPKWAYIRQRPYFHQFFFAISGAVLFIFIRSVYRVAELAEGWNGYLIRTERFFLVLDGLMVLLACLIMTVFHPGFAFGRKPIPVRGLHYKHSSAPLYENDASDLDSQQFSNKLEENRDAPADF